MGGIVESSAKLFALGRYLLVHIVESYPPRAEEEERDHAGVTR